MVNNKTLNNTTTTTTKKVWDVVIANSYILQTLVFYIGLCLQFVRSFLGLGLDYSNTLKKKTQQDLFPVNSNIQPCELQSARTCATQLGTRLVPIKNASGEIEWKFVEDNNKNQIQNSNFDIPSTEFFDLLLAKIQSQNKAHHSNQVFSPISEASSIANDNLDASKLVFQQAKAKKMQLASPASSTLSPPSHDNKQVVDLSPQTSNRSNSSAENEMKSEGEDFMEMEMEEEEDEEEDELDKDGVKIKKKHSCPYCPASFRIRGYLTRHMKKHSSEKLYKCPFYGLKDAHKCHATGGFSRRDTYKTHLKSRHFKYPSGTKSANRTGMIGWCGLCGQSFANNEIWVETHVETGECSGLPNSYQKRDSSKKKTGKRSHLLDVVTTHTPPPLDLKKSLISSCSSPTSITSNINSHIKLEQPQLSHSPLSSIYSPSPSMMPALSSRPKQEQKELKNSNLDAFYYKPTQYNTIPFTQSKNNDMDKDEDFAPMDDGFYRIREPHFTQAFDACKSQFPDYGI